MVGVIIEYPPNLSRFSSTLAAELRNNTMQQVTVTALQVLNRGRLDLLRSKGKWSWWGNLRERDNWGELGVDGSIIIGRISRRWDVGIWTGLGWPRIEIGGGRL